MITKPRARWYAAGFAAKGCRDAVRYATQLERPHLRRGAAQREAVAAFRFPQPLHRPVPDHDGPRLLSCAQRTQMFGPVAQIKRSSTNLSCLGELQRRTWIIGEKKWRTLIRTFPPYSPVGKISLNTWGKAFAPFSGGNRSSAFQYGGPTGSIIRVRSLRIPAIWTRGYKSAGRPGKARKGLPIRTVMRRS